jgi:hypothetical protein
MRRREFVTALGTSRLPAVPGAVRSAGDLLPVIGILAGTTETDQQAQRRVLAFTQALKEHGWIEGKNIKLEKHTERGV